MIRLPTQRTLECEASMLHNFEKGLSNVNFLERLSNISLLEDQYPPTTNILLLMLTAA